jgi:hypothetical protein
MDRASTIAPEGGIKHEQDNGGCELVSVKQGARSASAVDQDHFWPILKTGENTELVATANRLSPTPLRWDDGVSPVALDVMLPTQ